MQAATLAALLAAALVAGGEARRKRLAFNAAALSGSLAALAIVLAAPGNKVRQSFFPPPPALPRLAEMTLTYTGSFLNNAFSNHPFADTYHLTAPATIAAAQDAEIVLGLYDLPTLQRLPVAGRDAEPDQSWVHVANVRVTP